MGSGRPLRYKRDHSHLEVQEGLGEHRQSITKCSWHVEVGTGNKLVWYQCQLFEGLYDRRLGILVCGTNTYSPKCQTEDFRYYGVDGKKQLQAFGCQYSASSKLIQFLWTLCAGGLSFRGTSTGGRENWWKLWLSNQEVTGACTQGVKVEVGKKHSD